MIGQYAKVLLPLVLSTLTAATPHESNIGELTPGEIVPQRVVLRDLLPRQEESCGLYEKCGTGCMPIIGNCCAPDGDYYCQIGKYCTRGGCCQVGLVCSGSATSTRTTTFYDSRTTYIPPTEPTYTVPEDSNESSTSDHIVPIMTTVSASPSSSSAIPSRTASVGDSDETDSEEPSSSIAMPSPTTAESTSTPSASEVPPQVTVNAASPNGATDMGRLAAAAGLAVGIWGVI